MIDDTFTATGPRDYDADSIEKMKASSNVDLQNAGITLTNTNNGRADGQTLADLMKVVDWMKKGCAAVGVPLPPDFGIGSTP